MENNEMGSIDNMRKVLLREFRDRLELVKESLQVGDYKKTEILVDRFLSTIYEDLQD